MPAQVTELRAAIKSLIETEFATEITGGWQVWDDRLHGSLGFDGVARFGLSPELEVPQATDSLVKQPEILVQFYGAYDKKVDPYQDIDPATVENVADRLMRSMKDNNDVGTDRLWFFKWLGTTYINDPTGNKTRFHMRIQGYGNNPSLIETTG